MPATPDSTTTSESRCPKRPYADYLVGVERDIPVAFADAERAQIQVCVETDCNVFSTFRSKLVAGEGYGRHIEGTLRANGNGGALFEAVIDIGPARPFDRTHVTVSMTLSNGKVINIASGDILWTGDTCDPQPTESSI